MKEQAEVIAQSNVFLTNAGGGSASSLFLPRGSTMIMYYDQGKKFDLDLYDSLAYFHIDWLLCGDSINATMALVEKGLQTPVFR